MGKPNVEADTALWPVHSGSDRQAVAMGSGSFRKFLDGFIENHGLPEEYVLQASQFFLPIADWLVSELVQSSETTLIAGIYGAQGSGKSTLADLLCQYVRSAKGRSVVSVSIDDFYLTRKERQELATTVHPLLATRGPPGTHDVELAVNTLSRLTSLSKGQSIAIPRFDKAIDDRVPVSEWSRVTGPIDLVIFEGWCLGCKPEPPKKLVVPINELERRDDSDGSWRRFVNDSIRNYQELFRFIHRLIVLQTKRFEYVFRWRREQERKLRSTRSAAAVGIMKDSEVDQFVQLFERVSRNAERQAADAADVLVLQDDKRKIRSVEYR